MMLRTLLATCCFMVAATSVVLARMPSLEPAQHGDFDHYTLALTWQPGFCVDGSCLPDTAHQPLIGIHGLWASLPQDLMDRGIVNKQWWEKGCDYYQHSSAPPSLPVSVKHDLDTVMPQTRSDLLRHEYDKHVQCFGFDPTIFFQTELAMRDAVAATPFATDLIARAGQQATRDDLLASFARSFRTAWPRALQLQCHTDQSGRVVLAQLWITIRKDQIAAFPAPSSFANSPVPQDNCPSGFTIPTW